jgi:hypothetical protein
VTIGRWEGFHFSHANTTASNSFLVVV